MILRREDSKDINKLKKNSSKKVWCRCYDCNIEYLVCYKYAIKNIEKGVPNRCPSCRGIEINSRASVKERNVQTSKKTWEDPEFREKVGRRISEAKKRNWNTKTDDERVSKKRIPLEAILHEFETEGYTVLTTPEEWLGITKTNIKYRCPFGHEYFVFLKHWKERKARCPYCTGRKIKVSHERVKEALESAGYTLLNQVKNSYTLIEYICPVGHMGTTIWSNWCKGTRCGECAKFTNPSEPELMLRNFIEEHELVADYNRRDFISGNMEIDIIIHDKKICIEYNGLRWHSENHGGKQKAYHLNKTEECERLGYQLITIFEDEFIYKQDIMYNRLSHILGINGGPKIHARKCVIENISYDKAWKFLEKTHIQGSSVSKVRLGAFYNNELVSVMTFSKPSISKGSKDRNGVWELSRFCSLYNIPGIASKLLKYFKTQYEWVEIFSYADRRWSTGDMYEKLKFEFVGSTQPNYWYIKGDKRYHRFAFRKSVLSEKLDYFNKNFTEWENMQINKYDRIWDCGNLKYVMRK